MKAVIIAHGHEEISQEIMEQCSTGDYILCADGGAEYAYRSCIIPNYLIGDFDSVSSSVLNFFTDKGVSICKYPVEKDYTDMELCVNKALELGCKEICIIEGAGGRLDHTLGNIGLLHIICKEGAKGYIVSNACDVYLCNNELTIEGNTGDIISVIPFNGDVKGISLKGLKYCLNGAVMEFGRPLGISNEMLGSTCSIKILEGEAIIIKQKKL